jgi:hypothetical protein
MAITGRFPRKFLQVLPAANVRSTSPPDTVTVGGLKSRVAIK